METYLFIALFFIYLLTSFMLKPNQLRRIWTVAFILSYSITGIAIFFIKTYSTKTLMQAGELNWYYILYVFGSVSIVLGCILVWLYKKNLILLFTASDDDDDDDYDKDMID